MKYIIDNIKWNNTTAAKNAVMQPIIINASQLNMTKQTQLNIVKQKNVLI